LRDGRNPRSILTSFQSEVLKGFFADPRAPELFYLSGGTALAEFYLHHRYSDDLDFFAKRGTRLSSGAEILEALATSLGFGIELQQSELEYMEVKLVRETTGERLKVDFSQDVGVHLDEPRNFENAIIDSLLDIAVNKTLAIFPSRGDEPKDYVDLYFILTQTELAIDDLFSLCTRKEGNFHAFRWAGSVRQIDRLELRERVRMVEPFDERAMVDYFHRLSDGILDRYRPTDL